jgi:hypothetical protein
MISTMIYSLKDADERDRLTGTTFLQMNIMVGSWALLVAFGGDTFVLGMLAFSSPFFLQAWKLQKDKAENTY